MKSYLYRLFLLLLSLAAFADQTNTKKPSLVQKCKDHALKIVICTTSIMVIFFAGKRLNDQAFKEALDDFQKVADPLQKINLCNAPVVDIKKAKDCAKKLMDLGNSWFASFKNKKRLNKLKIQFKNDNYF